MDYTNVPTTVFTPLEYGCCGLSEEDAQTKFGDENVEVYHTEFSPLEWQFNKDNSDDARVSYVKVIVHVPDNERVVGFHITCPNAGEVTQGIGIAMKCGMTRTQLNSCVGIHPTVAEEVIGLMTTKRENPYASKGGC